MSKEDAASALAVLTAAYNRELPKPTARLYIQGEKDVTNPPTNVANGFKICAK